MGQVWPAGFAAVAQVRSWHECDIARSQMDVRFRGQCGRDVARFEPFRRRSCGHKQSYDRSLFRVGAACRPDFAAALPSSPGLAACALPLASCFLTSIAGVFDVGASDDFCLPPAAVSRALAESVLPLPFCFVASISAVFDLGAGDSLCRPAAIALELAPTVCTLPLPSCFLPSVAKFFGLSTG